MAAGVRRVPLSRRRRRPPASAGPHSCADPPGDRTGAVATSRRDDSHTPPGIATDEELIGLISLRRRTPSSGGTISYILREDTWGNGYATLAASQAVSAAFTTADAVIAVPGVAGGRTSGTRRRQAG
ncbi:GNAT family N-acetyltransferase [Streptomyces sp. SID2999]|nr:GNAT family N-acetyltransferase [Streptomyces sp. SID2999]